MRISRFRDLSLRHKLTAIALVTTGVALVLACTVLIVFDQVTARHALERNIVTTAQMTSANTSAALLFGDEIDAKRLLNALAVDRHVVYAALYDSTGALFASYLSPHPRAPTQAAESVQPPQRISVEKGGSEWLPGRLLVDQPVVLDGDRIGVVVVHSTLEGSTTRWQRVVAVVGFIILGVFGVGALLAQYLAEARLRSDSEPGASGPGDSGRPRLLAVRAPRRQ